MRRKTNDFGRILLLTQSYVPIGVISRKRAMDLVMFRNKAEVLENYTDSDKFDPAVIKLTVRIPDVYKLRKSTYTKGNVFKRDEYTCVYCGKKPPMKDLTIDHVVPRSRGGESSFKNCVAACQSCNSYKDNMTPEEAGMRILYQPAVRAVVLATGLYVGKNIPEQWDIYVGPR